MGANAQAVQKLYVAYFNRPADTSGLAFWENIVTLQNGDTSQISTEFSKSAEYIAAYGNMSNTEIVMRVYQNLFGRSAEAGGLAFWVDALDHQRVTIDNAVTQIAQGAQSTDLLAYTAKVSGAQAFTDALTPSANTDYSGAGAIQVAKNFISGITNADNLLAATQPEALEATFGALAASHATPQNISLTTGADTIVPTEQISLGANDFFIANSSGSAQTLDASDVIDGGLGKNTLLLASTTHGALTLPAGLHISNIQTATITSDSSASLDTNSWSGLTTVTLSSNGGTSLSGAATTSATITDQLGSGSISIDGLNKVTLTSTGSDGSGTIKIGSNTAVSGEVVVSNTSNLNGNNITINGGSNITLSQAYTNTVPRVVQAGTETIIGSLNTQNVTINNQGQYSPNGTGLTYVQNKVTITDASFSSKTVGGSISKVAISGFADATIQDSALTTLDLTDGTGNVKIDLGSLTNQPGNKTLNLNLKGVNAGFDLSSAYTTVNIDTGSGSTSPVFVSNLQDSALTTLNISGAENISLPNLSTLGALRTLNYTGTGNISGNIGTLSVANINAQNAASATFTLDASKTEYQGGAGRDNIILIGGAPSKVISLGDGNDSLDISAIAIPTGGIDGGDGIDTLIASSDQLTSLADQSSTAILSGFDSLTISGALTGQTLDASRLGTVKNVTLAQGGSYNITNLANFSDIQLSQPGVSYSFSEKPHVLGRFNTISVGLTNNTSNPINFASTGLALENVEKATISLNYTGTAASTAFDSLILTGSSLTALNLKSNHGIKLTETSEALTFVDGAPITTGGLTFTGGKGILYVTGSSAATSVNTIDLSASTKSVTYVGGAGIDSIIVNGKNNVITIGSGTNADSVTITEQGTFLTNFTTITDPHAGLIINMIDTGTERFDRNKVVLSAEATFNDYASATVVQISSHDEHGAFGWFQYSGSTYLVEARQQTGQYFFQGYDAIIKLSGLVDLSTAIFNNTHTLTLA